MKIRIEKGIPLVSRPGGRPSIYPFTLMEVGDSFAVRIITPKKVHAVRQVARLYEKRIGHKYATRTMGDSLRVWRVQ